jgi:hypothetical protein
MTNLQEYLAGTNPNDASSLLLITSYTTLPGGLPASLTWSSVMTRRYYIEKTLSLSTPIIWTDSGFGQISPAGASTTQGLTDTNAPNRFYRVRAVLPLSP